MSKHFDLKITTEKRKDDKKIYHLKNISPKNIIPIIIATITEPIAPNMVIIPKNNIAITYPIAPIIMPPINPDKSPKIEPVAIKLITAHIPA